VLVVRIHSQRREEETLGEAAEGGEGDATPNLLLKHPDVILAIYV
jgi:hypothetical protein